MIDHDAAVLPKRNRCLQNGGRECPAVGPARKDERDLVPGSRRPMRGLDLGRGGMQGRGEVETERLMMLGVRL